MKRYLLVAVCLILVGCGRQEQNRREILGQLETVNGKSAARQNVQSLRWAIANKTDIEAVISQWNRDQMDDFKQSQALSPEKEELVRRYEALQRKLSQKQMESIRNRLPPRIGVPEPAASNKDYETLASEVDAARALVADILEPREEKAAQWRSQFSAEKLVAEYAKNRFDLVVDASENHFSRSAVLYRSSGESVDITEGVIQLFQEKTKK